MNTNDLPTVQFLICSHDEAAERRNICEHLAADHSLDYYQRFTGHGLLYHFVCPGCGQIPVDTVTPIRGVCLNCFTDFGEDRNFLGVLGRPEILVCPSGLSFSHETVTLGQPLGEVILAIQPISTAPTPVCITLTERGELCRVDLAARLVTPLARILDADVNLAEEISLHLSQDGDLVAVVNPFGQYGVVADLASGQITMRLERGNDHTKHCRFPISFINLDGRTLLVHAKAWNRLDVSDPRTGKLLTERGPTYYQTGEAQPPHYLDYFHAGLLASPNGEWIADNGWVWHPVGAVRTWSLRGWVEENVWESEDGPSLRTLCRRDYFWGRPLCWLDDLTLAIWGYGEDDDFIIPAVRVFDVATGKESRWFAGPDGELAFDTYLFAFSEEHGTTVWETKTGERLHLEPGLKPECYHPGAKVFISLLPDGRFQVSRLMQNGDTGLFISPT